MSKDLPSWLAPAQDDSVRTAVRHLGILRKLLVRDYLNQPDWETALRDLARMAREALGATEALVATFHPARGVWSAVTSEGKSLASGEISDHGSMSVLEQVRQSGVPLLTTEETPLELNSESLRGQQVESVLAVPLYCWDVTRSQPVRQLLGCLYAHRTAKEGPFVQSDVELMLDITRIAQPNLNLLRHLQELRTDLEVSKEELAELRQTVAQASRLGHYETRDPWFAQHVIGRLRHLSQAEKVGLLLLGPTGSGKSHLAQAYHYECPRGGGPFVTLDCSQVTSAETLAAELFGYAPNAGYANAPPRGRPGKAKLADRGTLFIDEIGALPSELQQRLLRLIQDGCFSPLGSAEELQVDIQVIAATNEDLAELVRQKRFREDLLWRVREVTIRLPSLDQRAADIPDLARRFLEKARARYGRQGLQDFTAGALRALAGHAWSRAGNLRGMEHTINRAVLLAPAEASRLGVEHLEFEDGLEPAAAPIQAPPSAPASRAPRSEAAAERQEDRASLLRDKIAEHGGMVKAMAADPQVASAFGYGGAMPESTLGVWIRRLGLEPALQQERQRQRGDVGLPAVRTAILEHRSGTAAARALGISRDALMWQLRRAGLSVADILAEPR